MSTQATAAATAPARESQNQQTSVLITTDRQAEKVMRDSADELRMVGEKNGYNVSTSIIAASNVREFDGRRERTIRMVVEYSITEESAGNTPRR